MIQRLYPPESIEANSPVTTQGYYRSKPLKLLADQARAELEPGSNTGPTRNVVWHFRLDCETRIKALGLTVPKLYRDTYPFL